MQTKQNIRMTEQRQVILETINGLRSHPTADEIYELVRQKLPHISLGTVYRNLDLLANEGLINRLEYGGVQKRFDHITHDHYHIRCIVCGRIDDVPAEAVKDVNYDLEETTKYKVIGHKLDFEGVCPTCQRESKRKGN